MQDCSLLPSLGFRAETEPFVEKRLRAGSAPQLLRSACPERATPILLSLRDAADMALASSLVSGWNQCSRGRGQESSSGWS
jgi:hypothetical protein